MTVSVCEQCGQPYGTPHTLLPDDCILGHPTHTDRKFGLVCKRHYHWIDHTLTQIEELFALLPDVLLPGPGGDERHGTRTGSPAPGRVEVMALTDRRAKTPIDLEPGDIPDMPGSLASWARVVADERHTTDQLDGTVSGSIRVLRRERAWIVQQDWVEDYTAELEALHRAVAAGVGTPMWPEPIGRCPNCGRDLFPTIGVDQVSCRRCKSAWTGVALARLRLIHEQDQASQA